VRDGFPRGTSFRKRTIATRGPSCPEGRSRCVPARVAAREAGGARRFRAGCGRGCGGGLDDFDRGRPRDRTACRGPAIEILQRPAADVAEIEGELVHVHANEAAGTAGIEPTTKAERVLDRLVLAIQRVTDAGL